MGPARPAESCNFSQTVLSGGGAWAEGRGPVICHRLGPRGRRIRHGAAEVRRADQQGSTDGKVGLSLAKRHREEGLTYASNAV